LHAGRSRRRDRILTKFHVIEPLLCRDDYRGTAMRPDEDDIGCAMRSKLAEDRPEFCRSNVEL
jgi:hypothetical protein